MSWRRTLTIIKGANSGSSARTATSRKIVAPMAPATMAISVSYLSIWVRRTRTVILYYMCTYCLIKALRLTISELSSAILVSSESFNDIAKFWNVAAKNVRFD